MAGQQPASDPVLTTSQEADAPSQPAATSASADVSAETAPEMACAIVEGFAGPQTAELVGITYRQLDHWARKGLVKPSVADAAGSGSRRRYSYNDLVELKIAKKMRDAGNDLKSIARAFGYVREQLGGEVGSANIVISGSDVLHVDDDEVLSLMREGQAAMMTVVAVAGVRRELDADVVKLFPDEPIATQLSLDLD